MSDVESLSVQLQQLLVENAHRVGGVVESLLDLVKHSIVAVTDQQATINELSARIELLEAAINSPSASPPSVGNPPEDMTSSVMLSPVGAVGEA